MHSITYQILSRKGEFGPQGTRTERISSDFLVDGSSLLAALTKADGGYSDLMGCFVSGFHAENLKKKAQLLDARTPDTEEGRYLVYICPECGDIGCGAYAVRIKLTESTAEWYDFAYENGYEDGRPLVTVGPFIFDLAEYNQALDSASSV